MLVVLEDVSDALEGRDLHRGESALEARQRVLPILCVLDGAGAVEQLLVLLESISVRRSMGRDLQCGEFWVRDEAGGGRPLYMCVPDGAGESCCSGRWGLCSLCRAGKCQSKASMGRDLQCDESGFETKRRRGVPYMYPRRI